MITLRFAVSGLWSAISVCLSVSLRSDWTPSFISLTLMSILLGIRILQLIQDALCPGAQSGLKWILRIFEKITQRQVSWRVLFLYSRMLIWFNIHLSIQYLMKFYPIKWKYSFLKLKMILLLPFFLRLLFKTICYIKRFYNSNQTTTFIIFLYVACSLVIGRVKVCCTSNFLKPDSRNYE